MCFSAPASFTAAAVLAGLGTVTLRAARTPQAKPYAAIPLLFAVQQFIEGLLWLSFDHDAPALADAMTHAYSLFSHVLWPIFIPLAVFLIEPAGPRRRTLAGLVALGAVVSAWLLWYTFTYGIESHVEGAHIEYVTSHVLALTSSSLYVVSTTVSMLLSTHRKVRLFGALALVSFALVYVFLETWLVSIWCFCAALLSVVVYLQVREPAYSRVST
ncbi:hypothetical protein BH10PSE17_BH10PSE17_37090 [soil metagenome]